MLHASGPFFEYQDNALSDALDARPSFYLSLAFPAIPHVDLSTWEIDATGWARRVVTRERVVYAKALYYGRLQRLPAKWVKTRDCRNNSRKLSWMAKRAINSRK